MNYDPTPPPSRPDPQPLQPPSHGVSDDIYRGPAPQLVPGPRPDTPENASVSDSSSSSSSSASTRLVQRALATVVELAISRWARSSSSSDGSSSSSSSIHASSIRRRRSQRRSRRASVSTVAVDPATMARAREAMERARRVPRNFHLVLPNTASRGRPVQQRTLQTSSLPVILDRLGLTLRASAHDRRDKQPRFRRVPAAALGLQAPGSNEGGPASASPPPVPQKPDEEDPTRRRPKQVKQLVRPSVGITGQQDGGFSIGKPAWWLDVASPTWEDMRSIGTLLHLHPLTLEDILHQDPREKIELFPRLGYYFIVFRALDVKTTLSDQGDVTNPDLQVTNVYLTVFREGICSFHFADISEHADRVRSKIIKQDPEAGDMTSDLIAHGLMDSIVDAFMPLINSIELEVESVDDLVSGMDGEFRDGSVQPPTGVVIKSSPRWLERLSEKWVDPPLPAVDHNTEKEKEGTSNPTDRPIYAEFLRMLSFTERWSRRLILRFLGILVKIFKLERRRKTSPRMQTLLKMSRTRRMVILLARLLGPKIEIIGHLRKRFMIGELAAELGDVQDHIYTMQHSLAYYERALSHAHPAYLSFLSVSLSQAKSGSDEAILLLSVVSIGTVCLQFTIGLFSMNVHIPGNRRKAGVGQPTGSFHWFGTVISIDTVVITLFIAMVWYWWTAAKKKYGRSLQ